MISKLIILPHSSHLVAFYKTEGKVGREPHEIDEAKKLFPQATTLRDFVKANISKILPQ